MRGREPVTLRRVLILSMVLIACAATAALAISRSPRPRERKPGAKPPALHAPTRQEIAVVRKAGKAVVQLDTDKGAITLELDGKAAPIAVTNFLNLVKGGFYDGMPFHRVEPGFVIQAGDPSLAGKPPAGYTIEDERSPIRHKRGVIAMARIYRDNQMVPDSGSTQFYICLGDAPHLDTLGFTAFGKVTKGLDVIDRIKVGDKIRKAAVLPPPFLRR